MRSRSYRSASASTTSSASPSAPSLTMTCSMLGYVCSRTFSMAARSKSARCHVGVTGTDNNTGVLHAASETGMDAAYAMRTANKRYRTTPLRALWQHPPYFHDGSAATLEDVVDHYNRVRNLNLTAQQKADLVQFLKSF